MKKILVININWLGDILFTTPAIRALRENNPEAYIACMVVPRCHEMLEKNPHVDEIIIYDEKGAHIGLIAKLKIIKFLRAKKFDEVYIMHRSFTRALIAYMAGIPKRVGYAAKNRAFLLTKAVPMPKTLPHRVEYFLNIVRAGGFDTKNKDYEFAITNEDKAFAANFLTQAGVKADAFIVILNPGGNWEHKRWPKENFAKLGNLLQENFSADIVISGSKKDLTLAEDIAALMRKKPIIAAGKTTIRTLAALMQRSSYVISADSGPMHIALAMKTPKVIALFGPTLPSITGPYAGTNSTVLRKDVGCAVPCYKQDCRDFKCMRAISPDEIITIIKNDKKR